MTVAQRLGAFLGSILLATATIAYGQEATLIVHNNTGATLTIVTQNSHSSGTESQPIVVPPESTGQGRVPMGQSVILAEAIYMNGSPDAAWNYNFHTSGSHELEIFASNFGFSVMFDPPGSGAGAAQATELEPRTPTPSELAAIRALGLLEEPTRGNDCRDGTVDPSYYLVQFVNNCPAGYITRGRHPPGSSEARWCAYCGAGYESRLDRAGCCVPSTE
ncbi:hypothetical protein [Nioella aestuarii]|uniref:hypothetical protein n=1 Tax=Nioella aestuarii TaxID=1662864 RepID=UPI003D7F6039